MKTHSIELQLKGIDLTKLHVKNLLWLLENLEKSGSIEQLPLNADILFNYMSASDDLKAAQKSDGRKIDKNCTLSEKECTTTFANFAAALKTASKSTTEEKKSAALKIIDCIGNVKYFNKGHRENKLKNINQINENLKKLQSEIVKSGTSDFYNEFNLKLETFNNAYIQYLNSDNNKNRGKRGKMRNSYIKELKKLIEAIDAYLILYGINSNTHIAKAVEIINESIQKKKYDYPQLT